ncbi:unnamed protein product [Closterium sp. Naga37s-1]|nr:unnamed protein product [Closterium sp. Naga37s-1]
MPIPKPTACHHAFPASSPLSTCVSCRIASRLAFSRQITSASGFSPSLCSPRPAALASVSFPSHIGHIAKAERDLKEQLRWVDVVIEVRDARIPLASTHPQQQQLRWVDVVIEVRDARIPLATTHPQLDEWIGGKPNVLVLNREDMVTAGDRKAWAKYYGGWTPYPNPPFSPIT